MLINFENATSAIWTHWVCQTLSYASHIFSSNTELRVDNIAGNISKLVWFLVKSLRYNWMKPLCSTLCTIHSYLIPTSLCMNSIWSIKQMCCLLTSYLRWKKTFRMKNASKPFAYNCRHQEFRHLQNLFIPWNSITIKLIVCILFRMFFSEFTSSWLQHEKEVFSTLLELIDYLMS